jgi:DNA-binding phage protein
VDFEETARELMRALRGSRSQVAWSRRLGYSSNVAYPWETGRRYPNASEALRAIRRSGRDLDKGLTDFLGRRPSWLGEVEADSDAGLVHLLEELRGSRAITEIARASGISRHALGRWFRGSAQPRLPEFLQLIEVTSVRLVDFVTSFVDPGDMPYTIEPAWRLMEARREGAGKYPWTQAILRALELESYKALPEHQPGWIARRLGIDVAIEDECMAFLRESGQLVWTGTHFRKEALVVDTRRRPDIGRRLKRHWAQVAADEVVAGNPGQFSYNVFACTDEDFEKIRNLHLAYFRAMRSIVGEAEYGERVAVVNVQLFSPGER